MIFSFKRLVSEFFQSRKEVEIKLRVTNGWQICPEV
jgi:hypothetical protein